VGIGSDRPREALQQTAGICGLNRTLDTWEPRGRVHCILHASCIAFAGSRIKAEELGLWKGGADGLDWTGWRSVVEPSVCTRETVMSRRARCRCSRLMSPCPRYVKKYLEVAHLA
jgi:hypothetical protein